MNPLSIFDCQHYDCLHSLFGSSVATPLVSVEPNNGDHPVLPLSDDKPIVFMQQHNVVDLNTTRQWLRMKMQASLEDCASVPFNPHATLLNIWLVDDPALEEMWALRVGEQAEKYRAETFYTFTVDQIKYEYSSLDASPECQYLHRFLTKGLPDWVLSRTLPALGGQHHQYSYKYIQDADLFGVCEWNLYLDHVNALYGDRFPTLAFQQWHALSSSGAQDVGGHPSSVFFHYASTHADPSAWWRALCAQDLDDDALRMQRQLRDMYGMIADHYHDRDLHAMEATLALSGFPPPLDHPRHADLRALFYQSRYLLPAQTPWVVDSAQFTDGGNHPICRWYATNVLLGRQLWLNDHVDYYIEQCIEPVMQPLEIFDLSNGSGA